MTGSRRSRDNRPVSLAAVFEYEVEPAGAAAFEAVYAGDGEWARFFAPADELAALERRGQVLLRYDGENPNGSVGAVAGVTNEAGNVCALMPHPEHAVDPLLGSADGTFVLASLVDAAREQEQALV